MLVDDKLLAQLAARSKQIKDEMFTSPPKDMMDFNNRLGRWLETDELLRDLEQQAKGIENDE